MSTDKAALRARFLQERAALCEAEKGTIDQAIARAVLHSTEYQAANTLFLYVSTAQEIDTRAILADALRQRKTVCVPRCEAAGQMTARRIDALAELHLGRFGILEPGADAPVLAPSQIDLMLAPALACDRLGYRLGYGGGYYDRFLRKTKAWCGVLCAEARLVEVLPHETCDERCTIIFTERQVLRTNEK